MLRTFSMYYLANGVQVADDPLVHSGHDPEAVDTAGNDGQQEPLDPLCEQSATGAGKLNALAVNNRMIRNKTHHVTNRPRSGNTTGKCDDQAGNDAVDDGIQHAAVPIRNAVILVLLILLVLGLLILRLLILRLGSGYCFRLRRTALVAKANLIGQLSAAICTNFHIFSLPFLSLTLIGQVNYT